MAYSGAMAAVFLKTLFTMIIVIDPVGLVPVFLSLTHGFDDKKRRGTLITAVVAAFFILGLFIAAGAPLLSFLGVSPGAFFVSGGILLLLMSIDMLYGKARRSQNDNPAATEESANVAIFPLAIPMLAGPGAITTIMLYMSSGDSPLATGAVLIAAVLITLGLAAASMLASKAIFKLIGKIGVTVLERIMGLLLSGLAVQFIYRGLSILGVIKA